MKSPKILIPIIPIFIATLFLLFFRFENETDERQRRVKTGTAANIILFIGDGMGFEQVRGAGMYLNGSGGTLSFESFPGRGEVITNNISGGITDSAAAATAIATGKKVSNGVISQHIPGDRSDLGTLLEHFRQQGKSVGLVSNTYISHATPAAFGAHEPDRDNFVNIINDYISGSAPNILFGGAKYVTSTQAEAAGYMRVTNLAELEALDTETADMVWGQFGKDDLPYEYDGLGGLPHLADMTLSALNILDNNPDGFFVMVESGRIDHAGHSNHYPRNIYETIELAEAASVAIAWARQRADTLIVVTADHETGGLKVTKNNGQGVLPKVTWSTTSHTGANVPYYAWGLNSGLFTGTLDNTDIHTLILEAATP
jgi:alkaline phosphatase